ncbi:MAG: polysaccharide deacetylase family protein [Polaribacter sp.]
MAGNFIVSLDFELFWGVSESKTINKYGNNIYNTHEVVIEMLKLFKKYDIEATWATVGFLFFDDIKSLKDYIKKNKIQKINYENESLNNFCLLSKFADLDKKYLFALDLVHKIIESKGQELASHTFSHMYTLENGVTLKDIEIDIDVMAKLFKQFGLSLDSIVFPRNQYSKDVLNLLENTEIKTFRGNQNSYLYKPSLNQNLLKRFLRLLDSYLNISGYNHSIIKKHNNILDISASRFLRPYSNKFRLFEKLRLYRIKKEMTISAKKGLNYHLWWHPHNFGFNSNKNLSFLEEILLHQKQLETLYGFKSRNMKNIYKQYF